MYVDICEDLFSRWIAGRLHVAHEVHVTFQLEYCPEPYLAFGDQSRPVTFLTMNPGNGEPFQLRNTVDTDQSPIRSSSSYRDNAVRLARWYHQKSAQISRSAGTRVRAMQDFARTMSCTGILQAEMFPFHSANLPKNDRTLLRLQSADPILISYSEALTAYLAEQDVVCAISAAVAPMTNTPAVKAFARQMGLDLKSARFLTLKEKGGRPTLGLFYERVRGRVRAVSCMTGHNGLPGRDSLDQIKSALKA